MDVNVGYRKYALIMIDIIKHIPDPSQKLIEMSENLQKYLQYDSEMYWENLSTFNGIVVPFMKDYEDVKAGKKATHGSILMEIGGIPGQLVDKSYRKTRVEDEFLHFKYVVATAKKTDSKWCNNIISISDNKVDLIRIIHKMANSMFKTASAENFMFDQTYKTARAELNTILGKKVVDNKKLNQCIESINNLFSIFYLVQDQRILNKIASTSGSPDMKPIDIIGQFTGGVSLNICQTSVVTNAGYDFVSLDFERNLIMKMFITYMNTSFDKNVAGMSVQPNMIMANRPDGKVSYEMGLRIRFYIDTQVIANISKKSLKDQIDQQTIEVSNVIASFIVHCGINFDDIMLKKIIKPSPQKLYLVGNIERKI